MAGRYVRMVFQFSFMFNELIAMTSLTDGASRSMCRLSFVIIYQGAFQMPLRIFEWTLGILLKLDSLAVPQI